MVVFFVVPPIIDICFNGFGGDSADRFRRKRFKAVLKTTQTNDDDVYGDVCFHNCCNKVLCETDNFTPHAKLCFTFR